MISTDHVTQQRPGPAAAAGSGWQRARPATAIAVIRTRELTKRYGRTLALDRLNLEVRQGEVYGYLGPNGAGKTTTIRLLLGLHRPTSGSASIFGLDAQREAVTIHRRVAFVAGEPTLWPALTGEETLEFLARVHGSWPAQPSHAAWLSPPPVPFRTAILTAGRRG